MAKRSKREKDALDTIIDQLDLDGVTQDELFGEGGPGQGVDLENPQQGAGSRDGQPSRIRETFIIGRSHRQ